MFVCLFVLSVIHERQWQNSKTQSWADLRRGLWDLPRIKHGPVRAHWLSFSCHIVDEAADRTSSTVVGPLGAHTLVVKLPYAVCLERGHRRTF